jgi:peptidoglycan DL-endopeptidase CwlO
VPGRDRRRAYAVIALTVFSLAGAGPAAADQASETTRETNRLAATGEALAAEQHGVLLELFALEAELDRARGRAASLEAQTRKVEREADATRERLALVRRTLRVAERRLGERLRDLYVRGEPDALSALLGADSLAEMLSTFDNLDRFARQDRLVVRQVIRARRGVARAARDLEQRAGELRALATQAAAAEATLAQTAAGKRSYLARLIEEQRLNRSQLASLSAQADAAEDRAGELVADEGDGGNGGGGSGGATSPAPAPAPSTPAGPGTRMTVEATGYALPGTTATGVPVGWGIVAVDPDVIPLGTRMTIPGYGEGVAADTGSAVQGAIIDLWFPTRAQALAWGRRTVTITIH